MGDFAVLFPRFFDSALLEEFIGDFAVLPFITLSSSELGFFLFRFSASVV